MRVTMAKSEEMARSLRGLRRFKGVPGNRYRIIFPVDADGNEYLFATPAHQINLGKIRGRARCIKDYIPDGDIIDKTTGKPKWDGSCPYCEVMQLFAKIRNMKMEQFKAENPEATDKEQKEYYKELSQSQPAGRVELQRGFLVAVIQTDATGKTPVMVDGKPAFDIMFLPMTENQFSKKFRDNVLFQIDNKLDFTEVFFTFPEGDQMQSAKDLSMSLVVGQSLVTEELKKDIIEQIESLDLNTIEDKVLSFKPETLAEINRKLEPVQNRLTSGLTDEEKENLATQLASSAVVIDEEDIAKLAEGFDDDISEEDTDEEDLP
jgi:hypothetical protein